MPHRILACFAIVIASVATVLAADENPFAAYVRPTDPLTPEEQLTTFQLPPGFKIELVAAEPDIQKPMNMAFDERGRLWITDSREYPYPAPLDQTGGDTIKVLEFLDDDGKADRITTFADGLNIPIGLYPYKNGVIAFSIPNIWRFSDTDGDGKADEREVVYGPFGYEKDTHGMNNAFRRGFDGWLYACHGFNNDSHVKGADGHEVKMNSGNTYRFRIDGQRIEHYSHGQVNPFGMTFDPLFNIFTADCHSKPLYQILRGAWYPSFGKPDDGMGMAPQMMNHLHGSTAIAGALCYDDDQFPEEYRGNMFGGNVMTSRINRNSLEYHGSTIKAVEQPDFLACNDPWFRPVDVQLGPDGAIYIADFYNRIIGHYEVPLNHPGRDRTSGRIWKVSYVGDDVTPRKENYDLTTLSTEELVSKLDAPNITTRLLAMHRLVDTIGVDGVETVATAFNESKSARLRSHAIWVLHRLGAMTPEQFASAANDEHREPRIQAMKILSESSQWSADQRQAALKGLTDPDAFVRLAATDALGQQPAFEQVRILLDTLPKIPKEDEVLIYMTRRALRNQLAAEENIARVDKDNLSAGDARVIAQVALAIPTAAAGKYLADYIQRHEPDATEMMRYLNHSARYIDRDQAGKLALLIAERFPQRLDLQHQSLMSILSGLLVQGVAATDELRDYAQKLAAQLLEPESPKRMEWDFEPATKRNPSPQAMWDTRIVRSEDGDETSYFFHSLGRNEQMTGTLRSKPFELPARLTFYVAGHTGGGEGKSKNFVRLLDAGDNSVLREAVPPGSDRARLVEWDLQEFQGRTGYIEIIDGASGKGWAWLAAGRFSELTLNPSRQVEQQTAAGELITRMSLDALGPRVEELVRDPSTDIRGRIAMANALLSIKPNNVLSALLPLLDGTTAVSASRSDIIRAIADRDEDAAKEIVGDAMRVAPQWLQLQLAKRLIKDAKGAELLLELVSAGRASPRLLQQTRDEILVTSKIPDIEARIDELTADIPPNDEVIQQMIAARSFLFRRHSPSQERGAAIFEKNCAICHQIEGKGSLVGPQLDGIGARGLERLLEDILDPNRNVDVAFRRTTFVLDDGRVLIGLPRREEGATLVIADEQGKEISIPIDQIEERAPSQLSLMPANVGEVIPEEEFYDLLGFLLSKKAPAGEPTASAAK